MFPELDEEDSDVDDDASEVSLEGDAEVVDELADEPEVAEPTEVEKRLAALEDRNAALLAEVERLRKGDTEPEPAPTSTPTTFEFIKSDDEFDQITDRESMNALLTRVVHTTREAVLRDIPEVVSTQVHQQRTYDDMATRFYTENSDILEFGLSKDPKTRKDQITKRKSIVSLTLTDIQQKNSKLSLKDALEQTASTVRAVLGITDEERKKLKERKGKALAKPAPAFAQPGSTRSAQKPNKGNKPEIDLEAEVDAVLASGEGFRV